VILDLRRFIEQESPYWRELEALLSALDRDAARRLSFEEAGRLHYLYERAASGLARLQSFSSEPSTRAALETLVGRAYATAHEARGGAAAAPARPLLWLWRDFPRAFRRHAAAFGLSLGLTFLGIFFGVLAITAIPQSKAVLLPYGHGMMDPSQRVANEEKDGGEAHMRGAQGRFASFLMTHNIQVSILTFALGLSFGLGTMILLFYNGVILGAICADYIYAGQGVFLAGWLLPHGSIEIPAILIAGQAGLVLGRALLGGEEGLGLAARLGKQSEDLSLLVYGASCLLVWAGLVESFFSQYHEPVLPYAVKIAFGCVELLLLGLFLGRAGHAGAGEKA
jgi:uncharacterized membrane protein SpoIIM required for sporulation